MSFQIRRINSATGKAEYHTLREWNIINGYEPPDEVLIGEVITPPKNEEITNKQKVALKVPTVSKKTDVHSIIGRILAGRRSATVTPAPRPRCNYDPNPKPQQYEKETDPHNCECDS